jgi:hypothetical protein
MVILRGMRVLCDQDVAILLTKSGGVIVNSSFTSSIPITRAPNGSFNVDLKHCFDYDPGPLERDPFDDSILPSFRANALSPTGDASASESVRCLARDVLYACSLLDKPSQPSTSSSADLSRNLSSGVSSADLSSGVDFRVAPSADLSSGVDFLVASSADLSSGSSLSLSRSESHSYEMDTPPTLHQSVYH